MDESTIAWPRDRIVSIPVPFYLVDIRPVEKRQISTAEINARLAGYQRVLVKFGPADDQGKRDLHLLVGDWVLAVAPAEKTGEPDRMVFFKAFTANASVKRDFLAGSICIDGKAGWAAIDKHQGSFGYSSTRTQVFAAFLEQLLVALRRLGGQTRAPSLDLEAQAVVRNLSAYCDMEMELAREAVQGAAGYVYRQVEPVTEARIGTIPYRFILESTSGLKEKSSLQVALVDGTALSGMVTAVTPRSAIIVFTRQFNFEDLPQVGVLKPVANDVQYRVRMKALEEIKNGTARAAYLLPAIAHGRYSTAPDPITAVPHSGKLNEAQQKAVQMGNQVSDLLLVLGPPGTGKTTVIAEWVFHYVAQGQRLLISSKNNAAVDNVIERLLDVSKLPPGMPRPRVIRVGREDNVASNVREVLLDNQAATLQRDMLARSRQALGPFLQAQPLVAEYEEALRQYSNALKIKAQRRQALDSAQNAVVQRWQPQMQPIYRRLQSVQMRGKRLLRRQAWWHGADASLSAARRKDKVLSWLLAAPASMTHWTWGRIELGISRTAETEAGLLLEYERVWQQAEAEWHSPEMLALKQSYWEAEQAEDRLATPVAASSETAASAVASLPGFELSGAPRGGDVQSAVAAHQVAESVRKRLDSVVKVTAQWQQVLDSGREGVIYGLLLRMVDVVGATCIGINSDRRFSDVDFDITIVDEAGQIQAHDVMVPLGRSPKTIMVGDHQQLPPMVDEALAERAKAAGVDLELLTKSLFEILYPQAPDSKKVLLDTGYRMPAEVADFISGQFYDGKYKSPDVKRGLGPLLAFCHAPLCLVDTSQEPGRRERYLDPGYSNPFEARLTAEILQGACQAGVDFRDLGVITPYGGQAALIYELTQELGLTDETGALKDNIATVDSFQGQERQLIVYSFTRSNSFGLVGFLKELRRLNVALTRPQAQLILIGDFDALSQATDPGFSYLVRELVKTVKAKGDYTTAAEMEERLANVLV